MMRKEFRILSINVSENKGEKKHPVEEAEVRENHGIPGDAHAGPWHRQISLLADEDIEVMRGKGIVLQYGDFAENITTRGIDLCSLPVGTRLVLGDVVTEVTQIGKECHSRCAIFDAVGECVMPKKGIFVRVLQGGRLCRESRCHYDI